MRIALNHSRELSWCWGFFPSLELAQAWATKNLREGTYRFDTL